MDSIKGLGSEDDDMEDEAPYNQVGGEGGCAVGGWAFTHTHEWKRHPTTRQGGC